MQNVKEVNVKKEIIVKQISASKFEVYDGSSPPQSENGEAVTSPETTEIPKEQPTNPETVMTRKTVIQRAPPARQRTPPDLRQSDNGKREDELISIAPMKKRKVENISRDSSTGSVILIKDAIMYRIVDILMFKVVGESQLKVYGYPFASTYQVLWRVLRDNLLRSGIKKPSLEQFPQDHDCGGNVACFTSHVTLFLEICAPYLWSKMTGTKLSVEEVLRKIYYEDLIPYLRNIDLRNNVNILQCHSDIVLLEKWEKQKFTAVTWSGTTGDFEEEISSPSGFRVVGTIESSITTNEDRSSQPGVICIVLTRALEPEPEPVTQ